MANRFQQFTEQPAEQPKPNRFQQLTDEPKVVAPGLIDQGNKPTVVEPESKFLTQDQTPENDAERLTKLIETSKAEVDPVSAGAWGLADGAYFGFNDEYLGAVDGLLGMLQGKDFWESYDQKVNAVRGYKEEAQRDQPFIYGAGDVIGQTGMSMLPLLGPGAKTASVGGQILRGATQGAVGGGLSGAGHSENMDDLLGDTLTGAAIGGVAGGAVPAVANTVSALGNGVSGFANNMISKVGSNIPGASALTGAVDDMVNPAISKLAQNNPRVAAGLDSIYNGFGGGANGLLAKSSMLFDPTGTSHAAFGTLAGAKAAGLAGDAAKGLANMPSGGMNIGQISNDVWNKTYSDSPAVSMRDPEQVASAVQGTIYAPILAEAAQESPQAYMARVYVLTQSDPEFRRLFND